jgi:hypothetical protein
VLVATTLFAWRSEDIQYKAEANEKK